MKGFTLFEIIIVMSLAVLLAIIAVPLSMNLFRSQQLMTTTGTVLSTLRHARSQAVFQKNDSSFGVKFLPESYVLFQGSSYATRVQDEDVLFLIPATVSVSGISEVVFAQRTGMPNTTGTILIMAGTASRSVNINQQGIIEL